MPDTRTWTWRTERVGVGESLLESINAAFVAEAMEVGD
jgi:hypothetical protein